MLRADSFLCTVLATRYKNSIVRAFHTPLSLDNAFLEMIATNTTAISNSFVCPPVSFITPYWTGSEMMRIHLRSIREFHPEAPILLSKRGGNAEEMEAYRAEFGISYWLEECDYIDSLLRLFQRCETQYVCALDHDAVLLASVAPLIQDIAEGRSDLVGIEERIRATSHGIQPQSNYGGEGWWRFAPEQVDTSFILFDLQNFRSRWGWRGVRGIRPKAARDFEYIYGIGQRLRRHKYLRPYHTRKYGGGNLLKDGDKAVLWHQWYGAYREPKSHGVGDSRLSDPELVARLRRAEEAFLSDYPNLDFSELSPAWAPGCDVEAERQFFARPGTVKRIFRRLLTWRKYGVRGLLLRGRARLDRYRRLM